MSNKAEGWRFLSRWRDLTWSGRAVLH